MTRIIDVNGIIARKGAWIASSGSLYSPLLAMTVERGGVIATPPLNHKISHQVEKFIPVLVVREAIHAQSPIITDNDRIVFFKSTCTISDCTERTGPK
jgi:hypothetical protein